MARVNHQNTSSSDADGPQREDQRSREVVGLTVGPFDEASALVVFESGLEGHHIESECVFDPGGPLVIFPSAASDSAHFTLSFS
jgi:hypothetical protein